MTEIRRHTKASLIVAFEFIIAKEKLHKAKTKQSIEKKNLKGDFEDKKEAYNPITI